MKEKKNQYALLGVCVCVYIGINLGCVKKYQCYCLLL